MIKSFLKDFRSFFIEIFLLWRELSFNESFVQITKNIALIKDLVDAKPKSYLEGSFKKIVFRNGVWKYWWVRMLPFEIVMIVFDLKTKKTPQPLLFFAAYETNELKFSLRYSPLLNYILTRIHICCHRLKNLVF